MAGTQSASRPGRTLAVLAVLTALLYASIYFVRARQDRQPDADAGAEVHAAAGPRPRGRHERDPHAARRARQQQRGHSATPSTRPSASSASASTRSGVAEAEVTTAGQQVIVVEIPGDAADVTIVDWSSVRRSCASASSPERRHRLRGAATPSGRRSIAAVSPSGAPPSSGRHRPHGHRRADRQDQLGKAGRRTDGERPSSRPARPSPTPRARVAERTADRRADATPTPHREPARSGTPGPSRLDRLRPRSSSPVHGLRRTAPASRPTAAPTSTRVTQVRRGRRPGPAAGHLRRRRRQKYLLSAPVIEGTELNDAPTPAPAAAASSGRSTSSSTARAPRPSRRSPRRCVGTEQAVRDRARRRGDLRAVHERAITDGQAQISGNFTQAEAASLANQPEVRRAAAGLRRRTPSRDVGPSLAGNQLAAGILAGVVGLLLVMLYCLLYYRGLGLVVVASLLVAGVVTYALVLLLGKSVGFTLTLPGIAGLIVAIGITADSFIVYFERIRDEMRDGKSMRVAVETGWARARNTFLAADAVSFLAAVVLYIFADRRGAGLRVHAGPDHPDRPRGVLLSPSRWCPAGPLQVLRPAATSCPASTPRASASTSRDRSATRGREA